MSPESKWKCSVTCGTTETHRSRGPDGIHPRGLSELKEVLTEPLSIIHQQSWLTGEVPADSKPANVMPIYKRREKEDPGNYRPICLTSVLGKVMEQTAVSAIMCQVQDNPSQITE